MNRPYQDSISNSVEFFIGEEVEHTPTKGMKTLFVNGLHEPELVLDYASNHQVQHVYFGANHSFHRVDDFVPWEMMITAALAFGLWVTLDLDVSQLTILNSKYHFTQNNKFIPLIRIAVPHVLQLNYNTVLKIDDTDFQATNPGVWCHSMRNLTTDQTFTHWSAYTKDTIIK